MTIGPSAHAQSSELVQRGEYLARAADCIACHTTKDGKPYAGGYQINTPFGFLLTPNITPDVATGIGSWSEDIFYRALHYGVGHNGQQLYPAFPYDNYTKMSRNDVDAIFAFLKSLPPESNAVQVNHLRFPYNQRLSVMGWKALYFRPGEYQEDPNHDALWNRGAYLVEGPAHCSACHTPRNSLGAPELSYAYSGAVIDNWYALNINSNNQFGLGRWSEEKIVEYLKTGKIDNHDSTLGPMHEVVKDSTKYLSDKDLYSIAVYLKSLPAIPSNEDEAPPSDPSPILSEADSSLGRTLYLENCAGCHHPLGLGRPKIAVALNGNPLVRAANPLNLGAVVLQGIPPQSGYPAMPAYNNLSDDQLALIIEYVLSQWGCVDHQHVTAATVQEWRQQQR